MSRLSPLDVSKSGGTSGLSWRRTGEARLDVFASAGTELRFSVESGTVATEVRITNLLGWDGEQLLLFGSSGADHYQLDLSRSADSTLPFLRGGTLDAPAAASSSATHSHPTSIVISAGGTAYGWSLGSGSRIRLTDSADRDELTIKLPVSQQLLQIDDGQIRFGSSQLTLIGQPETLTVLTSSSASAVEFTTNRPRVQATIRERGWELTHDQQTTRVLGPGTFRVTANGATPELTLHDTPEDDRLTISPKEFNFQNPRTSFVGKGFQRITAHAQSGGRDQLVLRGTADRDRLTLNPSSALLSGSGYLVYATEFETIDADLLGGFDVVRWHDGVSGQVGTRDRVDWSPDTITIRSEASTRVVHGHEETHLKSTQGRDELTWLGSLADDRLVTYPDYSSMLTPDRVGFATGFATVTARSGGGGHDRAWLNGSPQIDQFTSTPTLSELRGTGWMVKVEGFDAVAAISQGGRDRATFYDSAFDDRFESRTGFSAMMQGDTYRVVENFTEVRAIAQAGGYDGAVVVHSDSSAHIDASFAKTTVRSPSVVLEVEGFEQTQLANEVAEAVAYVTELQPTDRRLASGKLTTFTRQRSLLTLIDFTQVREAT